MTASSDVWKSLAMEARRARELKGTTPDRSSNGFSLTLAEYPDFVITRTTAKTVRHLVVMPSAGEAFVKNEVNGVVGEPEPLTAESYSTFTSGMPDVELPEGFWAKRISRGKAVGERILSILSDDSVLEMIRKRVFPPSLDLLARSHGNDMARDEIPYVEAYEEYPRLMVEFAGNSKATNLLVAERVFCKSLIEQFGIQNVRDFLVEYGSSLVVLAAAPRDGVSHRSGLLTRSARSVGDYEFSVSEAAKERYEYVSACPRLKMRYETFRDYVLYDSVRMGYGLSGASFFDEWNDVLSLQYSVYGKLVDKYPTDLPLLHNQLSYKAALLRQEIDDRMFAEAVERTEAYEGRSKGFVFVAPKSRQDFYDEAAAQMNCLAGYVGKFTEGDCLILFMRRANEPERSYATVEIVGGEVVQAKLARNRAVPDSEMRILFDWVAKARSKIESEKSGIDAA